MVHVCYYTNIRMISIFLFSFNNLCQTKSRDHDARDYYKARRQQRLISDDRISKDVQIEDTRKRIKELETKLTDFATAYEVNPTNFSKYEM